MLEDMAKLRSFRKREVFLALKQDPSPTSSKGKEMMKELPPPNIVVDVEAKEEAAEGVPSKRKKKEKE